MPKPTEKSTRLYLVTDKETNKPCALVEAQNVHQARSHVSRKYFDVRHASQRDCIDAAKGGIEEESAKADTEENGDEG